MPETLEVEAETVASELVERYELDDLTAADRCDRCPAGAWVRAELRTGLELLFCAHHYAEHEAALVPLLARVRDERARINVKPSVSV